VGDGNVLCGVKGLIDYVFEVSHHLHCLGNGLASAFQAVVTVNVNALVLVDGHRTTASVPGTLEDAMDLSMVCRQSRRSLGLALQGQNLVPSSSTSLLSSLL